MIVRQKLLNVVQVYFIGTNTYIFNADLNVMNKVIIKNVLKFLLT